MGNIIRRKSATPVEARRVGQLPTAQEPGTVYVPVGIPSQQHGVPQVNQPIVAQPSATAHGSTTNVYITMPQQEAMQQPVQAAAPAEVHHHHHTTQYVLPRRKGQRTATSMLGLAAVAAGVVSFAAGQVPAFENAALPLATAGIVAGAVGLLTAILFGRSSRGGALAGILVCVLAGGYRLHVTGKLQPTFEEAKARVMEEAKKLPKELPKVDLGQGESTGVDKK